MITITIHWLSLFCLAVALISFGFGLYFRGKRNAFLESAEMINKHFFRTK